MWPRNERMAARIHFVAEAGLQRIYPCPDKVDEGLGRDLELEAADSGADIYEFVEQGALVDEGGQGLLHSYGRAASSDVAGKGKQLANVDHLAILVAGDAGRHLQVHFEIAGNDADEESVAVAPQDECLEDLFDILPELRSDMLCSEIRLVHFVRNERVFYSGRIEQSGCICFVDFHDSASLPRKDRTKSRKAGFQGDIPLLFLPDSVILHP